MNRTSRPSERKPPQRKSRVAAGPMETRRRFLKLVAAGSAALLASPASSARALAATRPSPVRAAKRSPTPAVSAEITNQKGYLATALKTIRDFPLAPGTEMAFAFRPMKSVRGRSRDAKRGGQ